MANAYLVIIHNFLSEQIKESEKGIKSAESEGDRVTERYYSGNLRELLQIRRFLSENFNLATQVY
ncbi:MAG: hypothetical protein V2B19_06550 [Pseudomonadota bacterium]